MESNNPTNGEKNLFQDRQGFIGWFGMGGSIFQWHPELKIGFAFVPTSLHWFDFDNVRGAKFLGFLLWRPLLLWLNVHVTLLLCLFFFLECSFLCWLVLFLSLGLASFGESLQKWEGRLHSSWSYEARDETSQLTQMLL